MESPIGEKEELNNERRKKRRGQLLDFRAMKECANKNCRRAGELLSDDQFSKNKSKADGLALVCRECNALASRAWYKKHSDEHTENVQKRKRTREVRPASETKPRVSPVDLAAIREKEREIHLLRFHPDEWEFIQQAASAKKLTPEQYILLLVGDEKAREADTLK